MMGTKDGRLVRRSGCYAVLGGTILAVLALGAIICAAPVLAQSPSARDAAPAAATPPAGAAPVSPPEVARRGHGRFAGRADRADDGRA